MVEPEEPQPEYSSRAATAVSAAVTASFILGGILAAVELITRLVGAVS